MLRVKKLIFAFKKQTKNSIWKHLDAMATEPIVYSTHLKGFGPHLKDSDLYLYANSASLVVVCMDKNGEDGELADEEMGFNEPPLYFTASGHRVSPVWQLSETLKLMMQRLKYHNNSAKVFGVLLTNSRFSNTDEMADVWKQMNVKVIEGLDDIADRTVKVNTDEGLVGKDTVDAALSSECDENIDKMVDDFINTHFGDIDEKDDNNTADSILPVTGIVEQNQNVSVKVDILPPIDNPQDELEKLVGCADIKRHMEELVALTSYNKMMREMFPNSNQHKVSLHSIFYGRPGTGKTTVCKIFGSLLHKAGALSKGHVVVCDRGTFIGTLWGDEERSIRQVLYMAQGGVLMIDEAYLLNGKNDNDPGKIVINMLMNILADETQRDIAIVLCGYKAPMQKLLDCNPGLQSRFPNKFEFPDFTVDELLEITRRRVNEYEYDFTPTAWEKYRQLLAEAYEQRNPQTWGNARFIANQLEHIYALHAYRCVNHRPTDKHQMRILTTEDIQPIEVPKERQRIGF